jgi:hypothetical protein
MFGVASIIAFIIAVIFEVADFAKGHWDWQTAMLLGFVFLAIHLTNWVSLRQRAARPAPPALQIPELALCAHLWDRSTEPGK